jgi:hypothetical protein
MGFLFFEGSIALAQAAEGITSSEMSAIKAPPTIPNRTPE